MARNAAVDQHAARELTLWLENTDYLIHSQFMPCIRYLQKKQEKGIYDPEKAVKRWMIALEQAAKDYNRIHGTWGTRWYDLFSVATREHAARELEAEYRDELDQYEEA